MFDNIISVTDSAEVLSLSRQRVLQMIDEGKLPAKKIGKTWILDRESLEKYRFTKENHVR